jgi:hypothetical protein
MTKGVEPSERNTGTNQINTPLAEKERPSEPLAQLNSTAFQISEMGLSWNEQELLREAILSVSAIRFGSISLTIHEGRLVEVTKTVRLRSGPAATNRKKDSKVNLKDD